MNLYDILGVASDATKAAIKAAYRARAKSAHPDAGGSEEEIVALNLAYETLYYDDKRAFYDATGETDLPKDRTDDLAIGIIAAFVDKFLCDMDAAYKDLAKAFKTSVEADIKQARKNIEEGRKFELRTADISNRVKGQKGAELVRTMLARKLRDAGEVIASLEQEISVNERALQLFGDVSFDAKRRPDDPYRNYVNTMHEELARKTFFGGAFRFDPGA